MLQCVTVGWWGRLFAY